MVIIHSVRDNVELNEIFSKIGILILEEYELIISEKVIKIITMFDTTSLEDFEAEQEGFFLSRIIINVLLKKIYI